MPFQIIHPGCCTVAAHHTRQERNLCPFYYSYRSRHPCSSLFTEVGISIASLSDPRGSSHPPIVPICMTSKTLLLWRRQSSNLQCPDFRSYQAFSQLLAIVAGYWRYSTHSSRNMMLLVLRCARVVVLSSQPRWCSRCPIKKGATTRNKHYYDILHKTLHINCF